MKNINHNYWKDCHEKYKGDADCHNPDLRVAMNQLYGKINGEKVFDFGKIGKDGGNAEYEDEKNIQFNCSPDGYSTYTIREKDAKYEKPGCRKDKWYKLYKLKKEAREKYKAYDDLRDVSETIAGEFFFPCHQVEKHKHTINQARGILAKIGDRIDLTMRDIKKHYDKEQGNYPLKKTLDRYSDFFDKFGSFDKYVEHCLLQDFCEKCGEHYDVSLWKDKDGLPTTSDELISFWEWSLKKLNLRSKTIKEFVEAHPDLFDQE